MKKLQPIYIKNFISKKYNAPISIDMEHFLQKLESEKDIRGIVLTYPNYYGIACDLDFIVKACKKKGLKVLIDCAHGAHFGISTLLPENPIRLGADMVVMSAHKTLPSLTQTAYLHIGERVNESMVDFYVSAFSSTSPSYIFMAAMDYARFYLDRYGKEGFENTIKIVNQYRAKINELKGFHVLNQEDVREEYKGYSISLDNSRMMINIDKGYNAHAVLDYLRSKGVQCEMSDGFNLVLIASPFNTIEDFEALYNALMRCHLEKFATNYIDVNVNDIPERVLLPWQVEDKKWELVNVKDSIGMISAANIVPYPPGIPLIMMGEIIDKDVINMIQYYLNNGVTVLGIEEQKIRILKF
jgi:arginine/lysine/ornithine decarboxylase